MATVRSTTQKGFLLLTSGIVLTILLLASCKTKEEKINQNRFFFWYKRENQGWIKQRLEKAKRPDLIEKLLGNSPEKSPSKVPTWLEEKRKKN